jgi:4-oxalocrotonate tautomerase
MPLVRIDLAEGKPVEYRRAIGQVIYDALLTINVPKDDRFQIITEHAPTDLIIDATYLGIARSADCVIVQITLNEGRSLAQKRALYKGIADGLHDRLGMRLEDVCINLVEVCKDNWSYGNGEAQYAQPEAPHGALS